MKPSRRAIIAGAAIAPAAVVIAKLPAVEAMPIEPPTPVLSPYKEHPWQWFVSHDECVYHESFDTMEGAIEYAQRCDYAHVAECKQQNFSLDVDGDSVLELLYGQNEDLVGEGEFIDAPCDQIKDLGKMVTEAVEAWAVKHNINLTAWSFADTRNQMLVPEKQTSALTPPDQQ